jgi:hypothetical protein
VENQPYANYSVQTNTILGHSVSLQDSLVEVDKEAILSHSYKTAALSLRMELYYLSPLPSSLLTYMENLETYSMDHWKPSTVMGFRHHSVTSASE